MRLPEELRREYLASARYACYAEGRGVSLGQLRVRAMNFGQHWRTPGIIDVDYRVELPRAFFRDLLARELPEYIDDCKKFPDSTEPFEIALREAGWPDAERVCAHKDLSLLALRYYEVELLLEWLRDGIPDEPGYVLNTIDDVGFQDDLCWMTGRGRRSQPGVKYQDV